MQLIHPSLLAVGQSYLEAYDGIKRFNLFTVIDSRLEDSIIKYMLEDYYSSAGNINETSWYNSDDLAQTIYQLPEPNITLEQCQQLCPEFFI